MEEKNILQEMTAIMREADLAFETVGGGTRHYLRDVLFPLMEKGGLMIVSIEPQPAAVWVKATDRLPGWGMPVQWRCFDGHERGFKETLAEMIHVRPVSLHSFEWLDESPAEQPVATYPGSYYQPLFDLMSQEHGLSLLESEMTDIILTVRKMEQPGREVEPIAFARWICEQPYKPYAGLWYLNGNSIERPGVATAQLYQLFKEKEAKP